MLIPFCAISSTDELTDIELTQAIALTPNIENGSKIYPLCASCHLQNGWGKEDGSFPVIAGQHRYVLIKQLEDIRSKNRNNPTMYPFTEPGSIGGMQGIADVTAFIASMPVDPNPGEGSGQDLALGERLYQKQCSQCHGENGLGDNASFFPRLKGQHYKYLARQLEWISNGYRKNTNPLMVERVKALSSTELNAIADYLSRLK
ncbi:MAG: c-type cytochrome [Gammaproteobacteria bacterium]|nr:c-type cytochrome [Gammaproteobacteria bacterium]